MNISNIIDVYVIDFITSKIDKFEDKKFSVVTSLLIFVLAILSRIVAYSVVSERSFSFCSIAFFGNIIMLLFLILVYLFSTLLVCLLSQKKVQVDQLLCIIFNSFSLYFLLLPIGLICYYFGWSTVYFVIEFVIFINIFFHVLKYSKLYLNFSKLQLFFVVLIPVLILLLPIFSIFGIILVSVWI